MLIFGVSLFSIAVYLIEFLGSIDWLRIITNYFAKHAFVAFLFHHQILYFVMSKIGGRISSGLESLCVFIYTFLKCCYGNIDGALSQDLN
jgi:hypothetical protein